MLMILEQDRCKWRAANAMISAFDGVRGCVMYRFVSLVLFSVFALLHSGRVVLAQGFQPEGTWQQVSSNAGSCSRCQITISLDGRSLTVKANNGWSGEVELIRKSQFTMTALGSGRWSRSVTGSYSGKLFRLQIIGAEERLHVMLIGSPSAVAAVFERVSARNI